MSPGDAIDFDSPVILIGGGDVDWEGFEYAQSLGYPVIAVDSGADALRGTGVQPGLIVGDMDSISDTEGWPSQTKVVHIPEQDTTDFEKALYAATAPLYLAFGFMGQRLDHSLAALHCLAKYRTSKSIVLVDCVDLTFAPTVPLSMDLPPGSRFSVNPVTAVRFQSSTGLRYPLDGLTLEVGVAIGISNSTTQPTISVTPHDPAQAEYLVVLPNTTLPHVLAWYGKYQEGSE